MLIHCIFEEIKDKLHAIAYDDDKTNILNILQNQWSDPSWLDNFFEEHQEDLKSGFYGNASIEQAVEQTIDEADELFIALKEYDGANLAELFSPLHDQEYEIKDFQTQKAKGETRKSWLRIYAVHFYDQYVITGGAIKLTKTMQEREHTNLELAKMNMVKTALKLNNAEDLFVYLDI